MTLRIDCLLDRELDLHEPDLTFDFDSAAALSALSSRDGAAHDEDAILAEYIAWLAARGASAAARRQALELARDALDLLGDPDAAWQALPVERWVGEAVDRAGDAQATGWVLPLARAFVSCLAGHGRIGLHGQRVLLRRLAAPRRAPQPAAGMPAPAPRTPRLAA